jgi:multidrug efflux pump subunit AcrA (membrane-fusion protein)
METYIVPPHGGSFEFQDAMKGSLKIGLEADPENRSIELVVIPEKLAPWARQGVSAFLEIILDDSEEPELAIPKSSIMQDGLETVFFRRNPRNPDEVFRVPADLGPNDGKWAVVYSGVKEGDEIVLDGVYELKLATSGLKQEVDPHFGHNH